MAEMNPLQENHFLKLKQQLESDLDKRVSDHLEKDRAMIKESLSIVSNVFKWTVGIAALLITILGIKTFLDIRNKIDATVKSTIQEQVDGTEILNKYDKNASGLYNQSLIESFLVRIRSNKLSEWYSSVQIDEEEYNRLLSIIEDKETSESDFEKCLTILSNVELADGIKEDPLRDRLAGILIDPDKKYQWLKDQDGKQSALIGSLALMGISKCQTDCENLVNDKSENIYVRIAAVDYLKKVRDLKIIDISDQLYRAEQNTDLDQALLEAVAYLDFRKSLITGYYERQNTAGISLEDAAHSVEILNQVLEGVYDRQRSFFFGGGSQDEKQFRDSAELFVKNHLITLLPAIDFIVSGSFEGDGYSLCVAKKGEPGSMIHVSSRILFMNENNIPNKILHTKNFQEFKSFVEYFTIKCSRFSEDDLFCTVGIDFDQGGSIVSGTTTIDSEIVDGEAWLLKSGTKLFLKFWDKAGNFKSLEITQISDIDNLTFFLKSSKTIDDTQNF